MRTTEFGNGALIQFSVLKNIAKSRIVYLLQIQSCLFVCNKGEAQKGKFKKHKTNPEVKNAKFYSCKIKVIYSNTFNRYGSIVTFHVPNLIFHVPIESSGGEFLPQPPSLFEKDGGVRWGSCGLQLHQEVPHQGVPCSP